MELLLWIAVFVAALAVLVKASDFFVEGAEHIGLFAGLSPMLVGVLIVGIGTSLPELVSSIMAVVQNESGMVVGNVLGSNITNILLVLGLSAVIAGDFRIRYNLLKIDLPFLLGATLFVALMIKDSHFSFGEALLLCATLVVYLIITVGQTKSRPETEKKEKQPAPPLKYWLFLLISPVAIYFSADWMIIAVKNLSAMLNVATETIALSAVALGTSLPEVVVSIQAVRKGKTEMAVGNIIGSNLFNLLGVMGIPGLFATLAIPESSLTFALPVLVVATALYILIVVDKLINRLEGVMLLLIYVYYLGNLIGIL